MQGPVTQRFIKCHDYLKDNNLVKSSRQFALLLDYAPQSLNDILKGKREVTVELCRKVICKFGVNSEYLFLAKGEIINLFDNKSLATNEKNDVLGQNVHDRIVHVPISAQNHYPVNASNNSFFEKLPKFSLPGDRYLNSTSRCFDVSGDHMEPSLFTGDKIICNLIDKSDWDETIKDNLVYVIVTNSDLMVRRVLNCINESNCVKLHCDNDFYQSEMINIKDIKEVWLVTSKISPFRASPSRSVKMNGELLNLRQRIDSQSSLIQGLNGTINALLKQNKIGVEI